MIDICYSIHIKKESYLYFLASSIYSILSNTNKKIIIHIFHDDTLSLFQKNNLNDLINKFDQQIVFHYIDTDSNEDVKLIKNNIPPYLLDRFSLATFYRLFIPKILKDSIKKFIYLDCDIIINCDIDILYNEDLDNNTLAAVPEFLSNYKQIDILFNRFQLIRNKIIPYDKYFNAGVIIVDIEKFLKDYKKVISKYTLDLYYKYNCTFLDQDLLNICFFDKYKQLDKKYNLFIVNERLFKQTNIKEGIYHYAGEQLLNSNEYDIYDQLFLQNLFNTNFFNEEIIDKIFVNYDNIRNYTTNNLNHLFNFLANKKFLIFYENTYANLVSNYFNNIISIKINISDDFLYLQEVKSIISSSNRYLYIFFTKSYGQIKNFLINNNLKENYNFINGILLLRSLNVPSSRNLLFY